MTRYVAVPASKASDLIEKLASIATAHSVNEFEVARIQQQARQLMSVDAVGAHTVLGCVAALKGDATAVRRHHNITLRLSADAGVSHNYAVSLALLEMNEEALEILMSALDKAPDDLDLLRHAIRLALQSGHSAKANALCERWEQLVPDRPNDLADSANELADAVKRGDFREEAIREVLGILNSIQRTDNVRGAGSSLWRDPTDPRSFLYERLIHAPPAKAAAMNVEFADRIAERSDLMDDPGLRFVPMFIGTHRNAGDS